MHTLWHIANTALISTQTLRWSWVQCVLNLPLILLCVVLVLVDVPKIVQTFRQNR